MNGPHDGSCCSHDTTTATKDDREHDLKTQARSVGSSDGCCGGAVDHAQLSQSSDPRVEQPARRAATSLNGRADPEQGEQA